MAGRPTIRVLHTESSPSLGGQELRILLEMEELAERGFASFLIARRNTPILAEAARRGLAARPMDIRASVDPLAIAGFIRFLRRERIDVVNAHNSKDGWNVALAARICGIPVVRSRHIANPIRAGRISRLIYGPLCRTVMTTSGSIREGMIAKGVAAGKIVSIPTGIDVDKYAAGVRGRFRSSLGIPMDVPLVGQVAVLRGSKGPHVFVQAALRLIAQGSPAWFVLVGEGPSRSVVARLLDENPSERIVVAGHRSDIPDVLADLDVAVLAACQPEGVPQAVLQAFAARVPVVASDLGGINEVAIAGKTAFTVPPKDPAQLAEAIGRQLAEPEIARMRAAAGYELARSRFNVASMLDDLESLYTRLADRAAGSVAHPFPNAHSSRRNTR
ncbi:MAG: glycosyltransferase family 4 protein [Rhodocyclaceae bacterium]